MSVLTREQWFSLPLALRQRWWKETNYGVEEPPTELLAEIMRTAAIDRGLTGGNKP